MAEYLDSHSNTRDLFIIEQKVPKNTWEEIGLVHTNKIITYCNMRVILLDITTTQAARLLKLSNKSI